LEVGGSSIDDSGELSGGVVNQALDIIAFALNGPEAQEELSLLALSNVGVDGDGIIKGGRGLAIQLRRLEKCRGNLPGGAALGNHNRPLGICSLKTSS
jgi:hypothetical protein